jgi:adenylate cyclase
VQSVGSEAAGRLEGVAHVEQLLRPLPRFAEAAAVGTVNIATDWAGTPRHVPLLLHSGDELVASLPLRTASIALGQDPVLEEDGVVLGGRKIATDRGYGLPLRFYGPGGTVRTISAARVLAGEIDPNALSGRVVLVGATVTGAGDVFPTPYDQVLPGVEVLATATAHLLTGDGLLRDRRVRAVDAAVAVCLPVLMVLLLAWHRSAVGFLLIAAVVMLWIGLAAGAFVHGVWLGAAVPLVAALPPAIIFGAARLSAERSRADTLAVESGTFRRFQPPSLAERLARDPDFLDKPIRQQAAVVFADLSGFTGLSESLGPDETRSLLKAFHDLIDQEVLRCHGLVASFMGDGAMILFGLPDAAAEDACHAVEACVGLCSRTASWLGSLPEPISSRLGLKIGGHFGTIVASRLGGGSHEHIAATGDTVNVASRLMEIAAAHGAEVAVTEDLYLAAGEACEVFDSGKLEASRNVPIRGRSGTLAVRLWRRDRNEGATTCPSL